MLVEIHKMSMEMIVTSNQPEDLSIIRGIGEMDGMRKLD